MSDNQSKRRALVEHAIEKGNGILRLKPAWVARAFLPPGRRFGLPESSYELGERGGICERWLASTTKADNQISVPNEGLSLLATESTVTITLKEAVDAAGAMILGEKYAATHKGLDRLAKIFDYAYRLPYHLHQMKRHAALVGRNPKEEAYYFPEGVEMGLEPESYLGVHPSISEQKQYDIFLPYLQDWNSDLILRHSKAYRLIGDDGFHIPSGVLHAPGSALTIELQEDSDVFAMMQARLGDGRIISKELLFKDVRPEDRKKYGERIILDMVDWETSGDPYFYENRHTPALLIEQTKQAAGEEFWIFYNTTRFSGKKLIVHPGQRFTSVDAGVYNILVWKGSGRFDGHEIAGGNQEMDELLVCHEKAITPIIVENTGSEDLVIFKFYGPDINNDVPMLKVYRGLEN